MTFFPRNEIPEKTERVDFRRAEKLFQAVIQTRKNKTRRYNRPAWARAFSKLRGEAKPKKIDAVLSWYCKNICGPFVPEAFSAISFRQKFDRIYDAMIRETPAPEKIVITRAAEECRAQAGYPIWRGRESESELQFIQASLNNYQKFLAALWDFREGKEGPEHQALFDLACWLQRTLQAEPIEAIAQWLQDVHSVSQRWDKWDGSLLRWVWRPDHRLIRKRMQTAVARFTGNPADWDLLLSAIKAERFR